MPTDNPLGAYLKSLREASGWSLREVEEKTERVVKNSALSQIENGDIRQPSPTILFELARVYGVSYSDLMKRAGYHVPDNEVPIETASLRGIPVQALVELDESDREELVSFLAYLQSRKKRAQK